MDNFLIIMIALLSFILGLFGNYERWRLSGKIYRSATKRIKQHQELEEENIITKLA